MHTICICISQYDHFAVSQALNTELIAEAATQSRYQIKEFAVLF